MEKISTPREALLPRAANLATLAVVVAATWWSGAQRPAGQAMLAVVDAAPIAAPADPAALRQSALLTSNPTAPIIATAATTATTWPAQAATTLAREGLQAVSYQTRAHR